MSVHVLFPPPTHPPISNGTLDVIRDRLSMLTSLGHSLEMEDLLTSNELLGVATMTLDAALVAASPADRRQLLVRTCSHIIAEVDRIDRADKAVSVFIPFVVPA